MDDGRERIAKEKKDMNITHFDGFDLDRSTGLGVSF